jgi:lipoate-protein ligase A
MPDIPVTECRLLVDPAGDGAWNMAVDEHLLGWTSQSGCCCWRFYRWAEPTLSLGYFQQYGERDEHATSLGCPIVRRASGGGAILHHHELTYSLTVPAGHPLGSRRQWTYKAIHRTLIDVLSKLGIEARLFGDCTVGEGKLNDFLCFNRRCSGDIVVGDVKIAGSAQRRAADAVLQHGSVLLGRSPAAPELAGLNEITGKTMEPGDLMHVWRDQLAAVLGFRWHEEQLTEEEEDHIAKIVTEKYQDSSWTEKRRR